MKLIKFQNTASATERRLRVAIQYLFYQEKAVLLVRTMYAIYFKDLCIYYPYPILLRTVICQSRDVPSAIPPSGRKVNRFSKRGSPAFRLCMSKHLQTH